MSLIQVVCVCGRSMGLPEKYAGHYVQCPDCAAMLRIPTGEENLLLTRWVCSCGQKLKARPRTGGRKVRCPKCSAEVSVPLQIKGAASAEEKYALDRQSGVVRVAETSPARSKSSENAADPPARP